jgi:hypothetical protein
MTVAAGETAGVYEVPGELRDFQATIRQIVTERIAPRAAEIDRTATYPRDVRELLASHDVLALPFPTEYGGTGTGTLMCQIAVEEIAKACASSALILMLQELGTLPIRLSGSDELKQRVLPRCASGEWAAAFALSEAEAGSNPAEMRTTARRDGDDWIVDGVKTWISNAGVADFYVVFAVTDRDRRRMTAFLVEADRPGLSISRRSSAPASARPPRRSGSPRARPTTPTPTPRSAWSPATRSTRCRRSSSSSPTWRPAPPPRASCSTRPARSPTAAVPSSASGARWPSCSPPTTRCA